MFPEEPRPNGKTGVSGANAASRIANVRRGRAKSNRPNLAAGQALEPGAGESPGDYNAVSVHHNLAVGSIKHHE